jgi:putative phosphoesterase
MKVALLSDIHANIHALRAVMKALDKESVEKILVLGDLVGYYYWPKDVVDQLRHDSRTICIRGNHEDILLECISDSVAAQKYQKKYGRGFDICMRSLSAQDLDWLAELPKALTLEFEGKSFYLCHGSLGSVDTYLYPDASEDVLKSNYSECDYTVFGHTHYSFLHSQGEQMLINPGSVGQSREGGGSARYAIVNLANNVVRFKCAQYDIASIESYALSVDPELSYLRTIFHR